MATKAQNEAAALRAQIEELQAKLQITEQQERADDLEVVKSLQRKNMFTSRELGHYFKPQRKRG
jgi:multidrug resistance efflux pump